MKRLFTLGKTEILCHWAAVPALLLTLLFCEPLSAAMAVLSLLLHECAHALCARGLGCRVEAMELYPFGASLKMGIGCGGREEMLIALAGPLCGAAAAAFSLLVLRFFPGLDKALSPFFRFNLMLGAVNLLPAYPLDGGRLLCGLLQKKLSLRKARTAAAWSGALFGCLLGAVAFYGALLGSFNSTLFLFAAFLLLGAGGEILRLPDIQIEALLGREEALRSGRPIAVSETAVYHKTSAGEALKLLRRGNYNLLRVVGERNRVLGELDEGMLTEGLVKLGPNASLSSLLFLFDQRKNM